MRKTYGRRYNVALNCFNVCKFMHYCTYGLVVVFLRYDDNSQLAGSYATNVSNW